jgi:hypothetical protein
VFQGYVGIRKALRARPFSGPYHGAPVHKAPTALSSYSVTRSIRV